MMLNAFFHFKNGIKICLNPLGCLDSKDGTAELKEEAISQIQDLMIEVFEVDNGVKFARIFGEIIVTSSAYPDILSIDWESGFLESSYHYSTEITKRCNKFMENKQKLQDNKENLIKLANGAALTTLFQELENYSPEQETLINSAALQIGNQTATENLEIYIQTIFSDELSFKEKLTSSQDEETSLKKNISK